MVSRSIGRYLLISLLVLMNGCTTLEQRRVNIGHSELSKTLEDLQTNAFEVGARCGIVAVREGIEDPLEFCTEIVKECLKERE